MSARPYTVTEAAERLRLHPKTVLRFIREGRLQAAKAGRAYRIPANVVEAFAGVAPTTARPARVTTIIDVDAVDDEVVRRLSALIGAAHPTSVAAGKPLRIDLAHDPGRGTLKVLAMGSPGDVAALLRLVEIGLERP